MNTHHNQQPYALSKVTNPMITIYDAEKSGHAHRVRLCASLLNIPFKLQQVSDMEGDRQGAEYLAINPFGQIPTIKDSEFILRDSIAIILYLAETYAPGSNWIPNDKNERARMYEWLAVAAGVMFRGPNLARLIKLFGRPGDHAAAVEASIMLFKMMDNHLKDKSWLVGQNPTLADIACYSYLKVSDEGDLDITPYTNILNWFENIEKLDGFIPMPKSR